MRIDLLQLVDASVLVGDPSVGGYRSAADGNDCTEMATLGHAPKRLDKWWRKNLRH